MTLTLATRGSPLALWQAQRTQHVLSGPGAAEEIAILEVQSSGDIDLASQLARFGKIGIFTAEVDQALVEGRADVKKFIDRTRYGSARRAFRHGRPRGSPCQQWRARTAPLEWK